MVESVSLSINSDNAKEVAKRFLEQHYSVVDVQQPVLEDGIWIVTVLISSFGTQLRQVRIDATNGKIVDWHKVLD